VIIPVYNGETSISQAVDSALAQTWEKIEVIVVDDGSTDRTWTILEARAATDPRLRLIHQNNLGVARARNRGITAARGAFIAPLDADDLWEPRKIDLQMHRLFEAGEQTGLVYCWWVWIDDEGVILDRSPRWNIEGSFFELLLKVNFTGNASVPLFRRSCLEAAGAYDVTLEDRGSRGCDDWNLALRVADRYHLAVVPEVLVGYRRRDRSMSSSRETMWRSYQLVAGDLRKLRPDLDSSVFRKSSSQFALYLAGTAFRAGAFMEAIRWGLRALRPSFPWRLLPYLTRLILKQAVGLGKPRGYVMRPGENLDRGKIPEPLMPYDRIYPD
jgi:glycosyltransferase involved in cell wall biosynthesis